MFDRIDLNKSQSSPSHKEILSQKKGNIGYQILHNTSPPIPKARALRSVITPFEVEITAMPSPLRTGGNSL